MSAPSPLPHEPVRLAELSTVEAGGLQGAIALLPTGATEAHGPHLPLDTDVIIADEAAARTALALRQAGVAAWVLPPLAYAVTEFAASFSGTLSLPVDTATALVRDVILAAHRAGFAGVVLCNAHLEPGNIAALRAAATQAEARGARVAFPDVTRRRHAARLGPEFQSGACHAGEYETSLVLAAKPGAVRHAIARALPANPASLVEAIAAGKHTFEQAGGPDAYFGWPARARAETGEALYEVMVDIFAAAAHALLARAPGETSRTPGSPSARDPG